MKNHRYIPRTHRAARQRGVVLLFALIALVIMLIAAVAMVRSFNSSLYTAGNIGFKRDLQNQSEKAFAQAFAQFQTGGTLGDATKRSADQSGSNYSATALATDSAGIPTVLQGSAMGAWGTATNDISPPDQAVQIRYVIDRLCNTAGAEDLLAGSGKCMLADDPSALGTGLGGIQSAGGASLCPTCKSAIPKGVVYRLSVKVTGPRGTQSFFQSTFSIPSAIS